MICPCKGCADRTVTCHGVCRRYQEWKKEDAEVKKWLRDQIPMINENALRGQRKKIIERSRIGKQKRSMNNE